MAKFSPIVLPQFPILYGFESDVLGDTLVAISPGICTNPTNNLSISLPIGAEIDAATNGPGGLDTGSLAANKFYGIFVIADSSGFLSDSCMLSANYTGTPIMPTKRTASGDYVTYDTYRLVGFCLTDGSADLIIQSTLGKSCDKTTIYETPIVIYNEAFTTGFVTRSLAIAIPSVTISQITCQSAVSSTGGGATYTYWRPTGSAITDDTILRSVGGQNAVLVIEDSIVNLISGFDDENEVPAIDYSMSSAGSSYLKLYSYTFSL